MWRSLTHYRHMNLAVVLAAAVASAVLTGALLVGDSVKGSLRDLTLDRLGRIDHALVADSFFRQALAADIMAHSDFAAAYDRAEPAILLQGTAVHPATGARGSRISILGVESSFASLFPPGQDGQDETARRLDFTQMEGQFYPPVFVNQTLLAELGALVGDEILLSLERPSEIPRESLLGSTDPSEVVESLRLTIKDVLPEEGMGRFGLAPHQSLPLNAFVSLEVLQEAVDQPGRVNAVLVAEKNQGAGAQAGGAAPLGVIVAQTLNLEDLGLSVVVATPAGSTDPPASFVALESREMILQPRLSQGILDFAQERGIPTQPALTYLANAIELAGGPDPPTEDSQGRDPSVPYSTITALPTVGLEALGRLEVVEGTLNPAEEALAPDDIFLNAWTAQDLGAQVGDAIEIRYYEVGPREELFTRQARFTLRGVVAMEGLGADSGLTPEYPGIHDADNMSEWNPPFPVDLGRVRRRDEDYWDRYGAAPKAFVSLETGRRLWTTRFGSLTSIRMGVPATSTIDSVVRDLRRDLPRQLDPKELGFAVQAVKQQGLAAASGAINLGLYFLYFSFFLIVSAALIVALFFRLGVEQRAREVGLLLALGFPLASVRRRFLAEGGVLAGVGTLLGLGGAVLYAGAMMFGLRTWWIGAVSSPFLYLHVGLGSLAMGYAGAFGVVLFSIWRAIGRLGKLPTLSLLRGVTTEPVAVERKGRSKLVSLAALALALVLLGISVFLGLSSSVLLFFGVGASLLVAGLASFGMWIGGPGERELQPRGFATLLHMASKNASLNPGRSLLSGALVSSASFVIVAVGANGLQFGEEVRRRESGAGGFTLVAESDIPLHHDLNRQEGRDELGFSDANSQLLEEADIVPFRLLPGEDVSCLNLYQPQQPRLLGVPRQQLERGGFNFQATLGEAENPWSLLWSDEDPEIIPAFGDAHSMQYILKLGLGQDLVLENEDGQPITLRLVGRLRRSLFQSELLISEENFLKHFPSRSGYSYFLIDAPEGKEEATAQGLEATLGSQGFDTTSTAQKLQSYQAVENTYLATFQTLGGLGLLLGTVGLAVILLRNIVERRRELATLRALGFPRARLAWMVWTENSVVLVAGLGIGSVSALVAVTPHLSEASALVPWGSLAVTLLLILLMGTLASTAAVLRALKAPLLPALKEE